jgi:hypothetical protein
MAGPFRPCKTSSAAPRHPNVRPTEVWRSNFLGCFITDPAALCVLDRIGVDSVAWECDYPHSDSTWPRSPESLWEELQAAAVTSGQIIDAISWQNAARFFRFDPFVHRSRSEANLGALRASATDVDVSETSKAEYKRRYEASVA